jgi:hypothetical protein
MQALTVDLSPGALRTASGSPFEISFEQWKGIHEFLTNVDSTTPETVAAFSRLMPAYADLKRSAAKWPSSTFPSVIQLSQGIVDYNANVVRVNYPKLDALAGRWQTQAPTPAERAEFDGMISASLDHAQRDSATAAAVVHDLQVLMDAVDATSNQSETAISAALAGAYAGGSGSGDFSTELVNQVQQIAQSLAQVAAIESVIGQPPARDIERIRGAWGAIGDDLERLRKSVLAEIAKEEPFHAQLDVEVAMNEWGTLAAEAQAFARNARGLLGR